MKNINYLDHPYWILKCLNIGRISIPLQIFPYIYFPQIFTQIGCMIENVKIPIDHHTILIFWLFQNLLILSHLSESFDVPAGCVSCIVRCLSKWKTCHSLISLHSKRRQEYNSVLLLSVHLARFLFWELLSMHT